MRQNKTWGWTAVDELNARLNGFVSARECAIGILIAAMCFAAIEAAVGYAYGIHYVTSTACE